MSTMATTPGQLIASAFFASGIIGQGQTASGQDTQEAFRRLNQMMAQWARKRYLVYNLTDVVAQSTGAAFYTVGTGSTFNIDRPDKLEDGCFARTTNTGQPVDYPLQLIQSREDYNRIVLKSLGTFPQLVFYDPIYPVGQLYVYPIPTSLFSIHILVKTPLTPFTSLTQTVNLPDEYQAAIDYNLQVRLRSVYRLPPDPIIISLAEDSLNVLRESTIGIPTMSMPSSLTRGRRYNVFSDTSY